MSSLQCKSEMAILFLLAEDTHHTYKLQTLLVQHVEAVIKINHVSTLSTNPFP